MNTSKKNDTVSTLQSGFIYSVIFLSLIISWLTQKPSDSVYLIDEPTQFLQTRAFELLKEIAEYPHYTTSERLSAVRGTIVNSLEEMGLNVSIQNTLATSSKLFRSNEVSNIIGFLPATSGDGSKRKALALVSHYDSRNPSSLGASDAGSGVVTILESLRAYIATGQQRKNDIIVIITDAEEQGLMGAEAFVKEHPFAKNIGLVLNFEARGSGGPSYMFMETKQGNKSLIKAFKQASVDYPQTNSLMYSIYKMLPNDTDLTIFKEQGDIQGFNFAFIDDHYDYHTSQDTVERLDKSTLNHQASYLIATLPVFANLDLASLYNDEDYVYFNVANWGVVDYPFTWVMPMIILTTLVFVVLIGTAIKRSQLSFKHMLLGFLPAIALMVSITTLSIYGWKVSTDLFPYLTEIPQGFTYNGHWIIAFAILLSALLTFTIYWWFRNKFHEISAIEFLIAPIVFWLLINVFFAIYLTGAGFFIITLSAPLMMLALFVLNSERYTRQLWIVSLLISLSLLVLAPMIPVFVIGLGLPNLVIATFLTSLMLITSIPILFQLKGQQTLNVLLCLALLVSIIGTVAKSGYDQDNKKPNNINYVFDTQAQRAYLFSYNKRLDSFTKLFFNEQETNSKGLEQAYPISRRNFPYFIKPIETIELKPVDYEASISRVRGEAKRHQLDITITPNRPLNMLQLSSNLPLIIHEISVEGKPVGPTHRRRTAGFIFRHLVTQDVPVSVSIQYEPESEILPEFRIIETSFDLADLLPNFPPRTAAFMPSPFKQTDTVIISQPIVTVLADQHALTPTRFN